MSWMKRRKVVQLPLCGSKMACQIAMMVCCDLPTGAAKLSDTDGRRVHAQLEESPWLHGDG